MKKHLISILLFILVPILLSPFGAAAAPAYSGASSWAVPELDKAAAYGLITDRIKNNVAANITREEFAEIAVKLYEKFTGKKAEAGNASFSDTTNPEILKAANLGLTGGIGNGKFGPGQLVTREQMATILIRALKVINPDEDYSAAGAAKFTDDGQIENWAQEGVYYCSKVGIIKGIQNKDAGTFRFDPDGNSSREVAVIVCTRAYELFAENRQQPGNSEEPGDEPANPKDDDGTEQAWNGNIVILDTEYKPDTYVIREVNGDSFIFLPFERFKYTFKAPGADYKYAEVTLKDGVIHMGWKDAQGEVYVEILMEVGSPVAYLNGAEADIIAGPYQDGDTVFVPVNLFFEIFEMQSGYFQGRLCFQYPNDFPRDILEGSWSYSQTSLFTGYKDIVTGLVSLPSFDWSYTFNPDGTYRMCAVSSGNYQDMLILQSGKYQIMGNIIVYYDQVETLYKGSPLMLQYEKKHMGDRIELGIIDDYNEKEDKLEMDLNWFHRYRRED